MSFESFKPKPEKPVQDKDLSSEDSIKEGEEESKEEEGPESEEEKVEFPDTINVLKKDAYTNIRWGESIKFGKKVIFADIEKAEEALKDLSCSEETREKIIQEFMNLKQFIETIKPDDVDVEEKVSLYLEKIKDLSLEKKILNPEEVEQMGGEMNEYVAGLKLRIDEIKAELEGKIGKKKRKELEAELEELQTEYDGLSEIAVGIETGEYEEITEAPFKERGLEDEEEGGDEEEKKEKQ